MALALEKQHVAYSRRPYSSLLEQFRQELTSRPDYAASAHWQAQVAQIDKYQNKLFADPITVSTPNGKRLIQPQRTNNLM
jgi:hypothetical protein